MARRILLALLTTAVSITPALAQDADPTPPGAAAPAPEDEQPEEEGDDLEAPVDPDRSGQDYDPAEPLEEVTVTRPEEVERIQAQLERIRQQRLALAATEGQLSERVRELSRQELSPVLAPREEVLSLTLEDATRMALANNPDYLVALLQARSTAEGVPDALGVFDPSLAFTGAYSKGRPPFFSNNPFAGLGTGQVLTNSNESFTTALTLSKRFLLGTQLSVTWNERRTKTENVFSLNPAYSPSLQLQVVQPLLRGFGLDVNEAGIKIAENNALAGDALLAQTLIDGVLAIEQAYWALVRAEEELRSQERGLSSAIKFLEDQRLREDAGAAAKLDVIIAQAGVAQRREGVIAAENALEANRDNLLRLVRPSGQASQWDVFVVPLDRPWLIPEPNLDPATALQAARERRPDYYQAMLAVDTADRNLLIAENNALPQLDVVSTFTEEGLGGTHHSAWSSLASGRFYSWSAGVQVNLPLFLRSERARARAAKVDLQRAEASLESTEANLVLEVRSSIRDIHTAKATIEASRESRILAARRLEKTRTQVEAGTAVPRDVLDDLAALAAAESREIQAYIQYRLSLSNLERSKGTLLDEWLDVIDPRVRRALHRNPYEYE